VRSSCAGLRPLPLRLPPSGVPSFLYPLGIVPQRVMPMILCELHSLLTSVRASNLMGPTTLMYRGVTSMTVRVQDSFTIPLTVTLSPTCTVPISVFIAVIVLPFRVLLSTLMIIAYTIIMSRGNLPRFAEQA
jgi:hypothetical protein